jgi:5-methylcytosine-specific restriction endonuclease McrA
LVLIKKYCQKSRFPSKIVIGRKVIFVNSTLLLNASYEPLKVISWERAVTLFFLGKVEVVEQYEKDIRSVSIVIKVPAVVRLLKYVKLGKRKPPLNKINLLSRDNFTCQYCAAYLHRKEATVDHVIPKSKGGVSSWGNVVIACNPCNRKKGSRTPREASMRLLSQPKAPEWLPVLNCEFLIEVPHVWKIFLSSR